MNFTLGKMRAFFMQTKNIIATSIWNKCNIFVLLRYAQAQIYTVIFKLYFPSSPFWTPVAYRVNALSGLTAVWVQNIDLSTFYFPLLMNNFIMTYSWVCRECWWGVWVPERGWMYIYNIRTCTYVHPCYEIGAAGGYTKVPFSSPVRNKVDTFSVCMLSSLNIVLEQFYPLM